ncbi:hypothetical protein QE320_gp014 [Pseudomonas phage EM]|uniref:Uncharacterized protein n=1 Tax=Pseudomonas phage EM TaxID=2936914 RepID=A0AAE9HK55_9CAUD|nr:hypothetical protein QE320_gp014 [Pseudomonas phage EM]UPW35816.1 hypothetical protein EM_014 [Pseudomonas phage EM]
MRVPTDEERTIRCLLDDIHGPLNLLFPGVRAEIKDGHQWRTIILCVEYPHPVLGLLSYSHTVPKSVIEDDYFLEFVMNRVPQEVLAGMLERAQAHTAKHWYIR